MATLDQQDIRSLLPHRYPMLLVDRVIDYEAGRFIKGLKNVSANEPFFQGHFPHYAVMPGVLVIEAMAQLAGLLTFLSDLARRDQLVLFAGIDKARFKRQVVPGDVLHMEANLERVVQAVGRFQCRATVEGQLVCDGSSIATEKSPLPT